MLINSIFVSYKPGVYNDFVYRAVNRSIENSDLQEHHPAHVNTKP